MNDLRLLISHFQLLLHAIFAFTELQRNTWGPMQQFIIRSKRFAYISLRKAPLLLGIILYLLKKSKSKNLDTFYLVMMPVNNFAISLVSTIF